ncbi:MAG: endolytic transglycosylase MltG, partial [Pseudomonadota bacterium]
MTEPGDNLAGHNPSGHDPSGHHPTGGSGDDPGSRPSSDQNQPSTKTEDQPPRISVGKIALLIVLSVVLGAGLFVAGTYTWLERWANNAGPLGQEATVIIEPGTSFDGIAQALFYNQVIDRTQALKLWARLHGLGSDLKAGEYRFDPGASPRSVLARLQAGDVVVHRHIIPEGLTSHEIFDRLNDEP